MCRVQMVRRGGGLSWWLAGVAAEKVEAGVVTPDSGDGITFFLIVYVSWWEGVGRSTQSGERIRTSLRKSAATTKHVAEKAAEKAQGRKYGYFAQNGWLKIRGHLSCGLDN